MWRSNFIFLQGVDIVFLKNCWRDCPLHAGWPWHFHETIFDYTFIMRFISWCSILFHGPYVFILAPHCFEYCCPFIFFKTSFEFLVSNITSQPYLVSSYSPFRSRILYRTSSLPDLPACSHSFLSSASLYIVPVLEITLVSQGHNPNDRGASSTNLAFIFASSERFTTVHNQ